MKRLACLLLTAYATPALAADLLPLADALALARQHHPDLQQARARWQAADARADQAHAPLMPQVNASLSYFRSTANFVPRPGALPTAVNRVTPSFDTAGSYSAGLNASWLLYDHGQAKARWQAAQQSALGQQEREHAAQLQVELGVRLAWHALRAAQALTRVADDKLANQDKHLKQVQGFVEVGRRPAVDLAQARADRAMAEVQRIEAQSDLDTTVAQLALALGGELTPTVRVPETASEPVTGEEAGVQALVDEAWRQRPELGATQHDRSAQEAALAQAKGSYGPSLSLSSGVAQGGVDLGNLVWNWNAGLSLQWPLYQGGLSDAAVRVARADLLATDAQIEGIRRQVRLEVERARLGLLAAKAALVAADEALAAAHVRLQLAEGRYQAGVGTLLEMADAQLALSSTAAQRVQSDYKLAVARAQLVAALGRR